MKLLSILGARPQFVKAAVVSRALRTESNAHELVLHTGQHYDENLSARFFEELEIPEPHFNLHVGSAPSAAQTGRMLLAIEDILGSERPDRVLVYGDTNSTLAGALAAAQNGIPVAHVEAGLRSFNRGMPEELNRVVADRCSDLLFAPTPTAVANLRREGVADHQVHMVGDVMYDAALAYAPLALARAETLARLALECGDFVLATVHRAQNTDEHTRLAAIFEGLASIAAELPVVVPLHPRTRKELDRAGLLEKVERSIRCVEPVGYLEMIALERSARLIVTDSGGVQKEAYFHRTPCVTLREETEWPELVAIGWNSLVPPINARAVAAAIHAALETRPPAAPPADLYGAGRAAERIVRILLGSQPS